MDYDEAKRHLTTDNNYDVDGAYAYCNYQHGVIRGDIASLDGEFDIDELEAIVTVMRHQA